MKKTGHLLLLALAFTASSCLADTVTFVTDPVSFNSAGLAVQTFARANVAPNTQDPFQGPLDSATNNGIFATGDILPGLTISARNGIEVFGITPVLGLAENTVLENSRGEPLLLEFSDSPTAVGLDLLSLSSAFPLQVSVFGTGNVLESSNFLMVGNTSPTFLGINTTGVITSIDIVSLSSQQAGVTEVDFGSPVPEPSSLLLLGTGLAGGIGALRRRLSK